MERGGREPTIELLGSDSAAFVAEVGLYIVRVVLLIDLPNTLVEILVTTGCILPISKTFVYARR